jgi:hypothetical protein
LNKGSNWKGLMFIVMVSLSVGTRVMIPHQNC